jgi:prepilin-type processing-associated H-X9-DG protein
MRTNLLAWVSLVLGVLALPTCGATAPLALLLGYFALRRVNLSDGRLAGSRPARAGMILGALGIVFFLVGLFVVGLYRLRGQSELTVCTNNLRRIGQAVNLYYDAADPAHFPPGTIGAPELDPAQRLSWMVAILPYMEVEPTPGAALAKGSPAFHKGEALYERFDLKKGWQDDPNRQAMSGPLSWFVCPASAYHPAPGEPALTQYVGLGGLGTDAPTLPKTDPRAGFFGYDRVINRDDVTRGLTETMMVTERAGAIGPWAAGGPATVTGVNPHDQPYVPRQFGGLHPGGANTLFSDGHAAFISDRAAPQVWENQSRINVEQ